MRTSDMVAQHQLLRMGLEIDLARQVLDPQAPDVVADHGDGNDEGNQLRPIVLDQTRELGSRLRLEPFPEVTDAVLQHVHVSPPRGALRERAHELALVLRAELTPRSPLRGCHQTSERPVGLRRVGHQLELVHGVEGDQPPDAPAPLEERAQPSIGEDALDEVLAQHGVVEPPFLLDGEHRVVPDQRLREEPLALLLGHALLASHLDPLHAAARRVLLEHVAAEVEPGQLASALLRPCPHRSGPVASALGPEHDDLVAPADQTHGLARGPHAELHLRADRHPLDVGLEDIGEKAIALVSAVPAHLLPEQTAGDADPKRGVVPPQLPGRGRLPSLSLPPAGVIGEPPCAARPGSAPAPAAADGRGPRWGRDSRREGRGFPGTVHVAIRNPPQLGNEAPHVSAPGIEALALRDRVEDAEVGLRVRAGGGRPLPAAIVRGRLAVDQALHEESLSPPPVEEQVLGEEARRPPSARGCASSPRLASWRMAASTKG